MAEGDRVSNVINIINNYNITQQKVENISADIVRQKNEIANSNIEQIVADVNAEDGANTNDKREDEKDDSTNTKKLLETPEGKDKKIFYLSEKATMLLRSNEYAEARVFLEELLPLQTGGRLSTMLMIAECDILLGKEARILHDIKETLTKEPTLTVKEIQSLSDCYFQNHVHIRALILLRCESKMCRLKLDPYYAASAICTCISKADDVIDGMVKQGGRIREVADDLGPTFMYGMLEEFREIDKINMDAKVQGEARSLCSIGRCHRMVGEYQAAISVYDGGLHLMKQHFKDNVSACLYYGLLLNNSGYALQCKGRYKEAIERFQEAIEVYQQANDVDSEENRQTNIKMSEANKKSCQESLGRVE